MKNLYVAIGVDCDPDRESCPHALTWRGIEQIPRLFELEDVRWTFNIRADTQIRDYHGTAAYCYEQYRHIWDMAVARGSALAWHLHYFDRGGRQDTSEENIVENIRVGSEALGNPDLVHMGWAFQNDLSIQHLYEAGVRIDYSPVPRARFDGRNGADIYDWSQFAYRPCVWHGVRMIPTYSFSHKILARRFGTERITLTTTTAPIIYRLLLKEFFRTGSDFLVSYFHADELVPVLGDWRDRLYSFRHLKTNLGTLRRMAERRGYRVSFVTIRELSEILFDDRHTGNR